MAGATVMKKYILVGILVLLSFTLLTSVSGQTPDENTLVIAQSVDAPSLDPSDIRATTTYNIILHLFGTLYEITDNGEIVPYLASDVQFSDDGTELTFTLNEGLTCEDGEPLTAEDVVYTLNRAVDPELGLVGSSSLLGTIGYQEARADDDLHVTVVLAQYSPVALGTIAGIPIHCKDSYEQMSEDEAARNPVGSGPYRLVEWQPDDHLLMERVESFTLKDPAFDRINWRVIPEASTRVAELIAGNVDIITNVVPDQAQAINDSGVATVEVVEGTRRMYVGMSQRDVWDDTEGGEALKDPDVRRALQYAIDVPTICETLLGTPCERAQSLLVPPQEQPDLEPYTYDPELAEQLLDEAGYPRGDDGVRFELTLQAGQGRYLNDADVVLAICDYLSAIGVQTTCELMDFGNEFIPLYIEHNAGPLFFIGTGGSIWSPIANLGDFSSVDAVSNATEWNNPDFFAGWDRLAETRDSDEQLTIVHDMLQVFHDDPPWILLYLQPNFYGVSNRIEWQPRRDEFVLTFDARPTE
jgi:peptide/nickel transport system substrate-binding protein